MDELLLTEIDEPRYVDLGTLLVAGVGMRYNSANVAGIQSLEFERYGEAFDLRSGTGPVEIWISLAR